MRIAVAYEDGQVFQHFGQTKRFKVYDVLEGKIVLATTIHTGDSGHGALADILKKCSVEAVIGGSIGAGAKRALAEAGIAVYSGVSGDADKATEDLISDKLAQTEIPLVTREDCDDSCSVQEKFIAPQFNTLETKDVLYKEDETNVSQLTEDAVDEGREWVEFTKL